MAVNDRGTLTGIYEPTPLTLLDGFTLADTAQIGTDPETGEILILTQKSEEVTAEDGVVTWKAELRLMVYDETGATVREVRLEDTDNNEPRVAAVSSERVWAFCSLTQSGGGRLLEWDTSSGTLLSETEMGSIRGWAGQTSPRKLITDAKGNIWLSDSVKVVVISPERAWINQFKLNALDLAALPDGSVWAVSNLASGRGIARLDLETGQYADAVTLWDNAVNAVPGEADGGYRFYYNGPNGICGVREDENSQPVSEELMTFVNSNVNYNATLFPSEDTIQLSAALSPDVFVMTEWSRGSDGRFRYLPVLYRKGKDLALSSVKEIQIAHWQAIPQNLAWEITQFNRAHTELRVTTLDYSKYNTADDPLAGAKQLTLDVITGLVSPDMLIGSTSDMLTGGVPDGPLLDMQKHGLALDLTSYLAGDGLDGDLFGCVRTSFTDGDGKLWGICPTFSLSFYASSQKTLGSYAEKGHWTTAEFLDFAENLPSDCAIYLYSVREWPGELHPDFNAFIDRVAGTCSFDSPLFYRYLTWRENLPAVDSWSRPGGEGETHGYGQWPLIPYINEGRLALCSGGMGNIKDVISQDIRTTGGKDYALIGRPSETGSGVELSSDTGMVVLTGSKYPDECWTFIQACLNEHGLIDTNRWNSSTGAGLPALKSMYDAEMDALSKRPVGKIVRDALPIFFREGEDSAYAESQMEHDAQGTPWYLEPFDPDELSYLRSWIDSAGEPFTNAFPEELDEIMQEEISAYLAGMGTPEECAKKIQSRASIWLGEHQ